MEAPVPVAPKIGRISIHLPLAVDGNAVLFPRITTAELAGTGLTSNALGAASQGITAGQALQGLRAASGVLGGRQQPQQPTPQMQMGGRTQMPQGNVDYSGIYNLLALQRARNPNSLLG